MRLFRSVSVRKVNLALGNHFGYHLNLLSFNGGLKEISQHLWALNNVSSEKKKRPCQHPTPLACWIWDPLAGIFSACDSTNLVMRPGVHTSVKGGKGGWMDEWMMANDPMNDGWFIGNDGYGMRSRIILMDTPQSPCLVLQNCLFDAWVFNSDLQNDQFGFGIQQAHRSSVFDPGSSLRPIHSTFKWYAKDIYSKDMIHWYIYIYTHKIHWYYIYTHMHST